MKQTSCSGGGRGGGRKDGETLMVDTLDLAHQACALLREILPTYRTAVRRRGKIWLVVLAVA